MAKTFTSGKATSKTTPSFSKFTKAKKKTRFSLKMILGMVAFFVVLVGGVSGLVLGQMNQDTRQQAYEQGNTCAETGGSCRGGSSCGGDVSTGGKCGSGQICCKVLPCPANSVPSGPSQCKCNYGGAVISKSGTCPSSPPTPAPTAAPTAPPTATCPSRSRPIQNGKCRCTQTGIEIRPDQTCPQVTNCSQYVDSSYCGTGKVNGNPCVWASSGNIGGSCIPALCRERTTSSICTRALGTNNYSCYWDATASKCEMPFVGDCRNLSRAACASLYDSTYCQWSTTPTSRCVDAPKPPKDSPCSRRESEFDCLKRDSNLSCKWDVKNYPNPPCTAK